MVYNQANETQLKTLRSIKEATTVEEESAMEYTAGYLVVKLQKAYAHKRLGAVCQCLLSMVAESS